LSELRDFNSWSSLFSMRSREIAVFIGRSGQPSREF
jgi:hypothetical protein